MSNLDQEVDTRSKVIITMEDGHQVLVDEPVGMTVKIQGATRRVVDELVSDDQWQKAKAQIETHDIVLDESKGTAKIRIKKRGNKKVID